MWKQACTIAHAVRHCADCIQFGTVAYYMQSVDTDIDLKQDVLCDHLLNVPINRLAQLTVNSMHVFHSLSACCDRIPTCSYVNQLILMRCRNVICVTYVYIYIYIYIHTYICNYVCVYVCACMCAYVRYFGVIFIVQQYSFY